MMAILLAGFVAYLQLPVSALPEVDYPTIQVVTFYPGASPDVMSSAVTAPLERQFGQVPGLNQMTSTSSDGSSIIVLQFSLELNIDVAEQEVQAAINAAQTYLPSDLPVPPIYSKTNPADTPILTLALSSKSIPLSQVEDLADTRFAQKISQLPGVGLVSISGGQKPAVRVRVNPTALSSYGINLEDVRTALQSTSLDQAKGNFDGPQQDYQIQSNDQLLTAADFAQVIIAYHNGSGFGTNGHGTNGGGGYGADYFAIVGDIAQDSAGRCDGGLSTGAVVLIGMLNYDTAAGTHTLVAGNFSYNNQQTLGATENAWAARFIETSDEPVRS